MNVISISGCSVYTLLRLTEFHEGNAHMERLVSRINMYFVPLYHSILNIFYRTKVVIIFLRANNAEFPSSVVYLCDSRNSENCIRLSKNMPRGSICIEQCT